VHFAIDIPADASAGVLLDCHLEFEDDGARGGSRVFKKNDVFCVVE